MVKITCLIHKPYEHHCHQPHRKVANEEEETEETGGIAALPPCKLASKLRSFETLLGTFGNLE
ncbi:Protein of unknown function [Pyronema omphalodes CBS 100304]|uniref:Uncharacterized protein n=1 Tax=Pyronema omphalodes (strain CBS 100304) TaxID=1076935 RepID=U4LSB6_PYROM|nr:Protein of unknown function [Pyronema omphalodes CBS 100304]